MLGGDVAGALPELRAAAESRMTSRARIESVVVAFDEESGKDVEVATVVHESLPCRVRRSGSLVAQTRLQDATIASAAPILSVPWDTEDLQVGMRATIIHSDSPLVRGAVYRLAGVPDGDQVTAQRWEVEGWKSSVS